MSAKQFRRLAMGFLLAAAVLLFFYSGDLAAFLSGTLGDLGSADPLPGHAKWLTLALLSLATFVSEDLACIGAGLLAATGKIQFSEAVLASFLGISLGDTGIYAAGHFFGSPILRHRWMRWFVKERSLRQAESLFHRRGIWIILITRFLPGTRTATYFTAGCLHAPPLRFIPAFALAAALWTPFLVGISYTAGRQLIGLYDIYEALALPALLFGLLVLYFIFHYGIPLFHWRGRRKLRGKWMRATRWEYWPVWQVNWLVFLYALYLGFIRYRRPAACSAVNPGMPHGGFMGESKGGILAGFDTGDDFLPGWKMIPKSSGEERVEYFREAMKELGLSYPVVLKPDEGQRGRGVKVIQEEEAALAWLEQVKGRAILQEFVGGNEYGVFYVRHPDEAEGTVTSVTVKEQLSVQGNGKDDLETLIYQHPRAIAQLGMFLDRFADRLEEVPLEGETIRLGELGTHALGALFLDGSHLITPELQERVDEIARSLPGFYFGRFDFKVPDETSLMEGKHLKVLEVNGLTSEATHIYDPRFGLLHAWKVLCWQWRTAYQIGLANMQQGARPSRLKDLARDFFAAMHRQRQIG